MENVKIQVTEAEFEVVQGAIERLTEDGWTSLVLKCANATRMAMRLKVDVEVDKVTHTNLDEGRLN